MALPQLTPQAVPADTQRVAERIFPQGNRYLLLRHKLGNLYTDAHFATLFESDQGRPAESPGRLALVTILQYVENVSDRAAAENVRRCIDWKYLLNLPLEDPGFHFSVLQSFRQRLLAGGAELDLLQILLQQVQALGLFKKRGTQRTDATQVLAAVRELNRLECVGETLRHALEVLATAVPHWLQSWVPADWFTRYGQRFENYRLPHTRAERDALAAQIGRDGHTLLAACQADTVPGKLGELPALQVLAQVWAQQYTGTGTDLRWRTKDELPPGAELIISPYDAEARLSVKRQQTWQGYKVHLTETCDPETPHLITHVATTLSTTPDVDITATVHTDLQQQGRLPETHLVDCAYVDAQLLVDSPATYGVELLGPVIPDHSWQARAAAGFAAAQFSIDWDARQATCPQGHTTPLWSTTQFPNGEPAIRIRFPHATCAACAQRALCTRAQDCGRTLTVHPQAAHIALSARRQEQTTDTFKQQYQPRAGVEGTIAQAVTFGLRRSRFVGLAKTHFQHICVAVAINLMRLVDWWQDTPRATTRHSRFAALAPT